MTKAASISMFGLTPQWAKGSAATGPVNPMKAHEVGLAIVQDVRTLDPEIGGSLFRSNAFKAGVRVAGNVRMTPRADDLGWLLYALCGSASVTGAEATGYTHIFQMAGNESTLKWASLYKEVSETWWETYQDCVLTSMRLNIGAASAMSIDTGWLGITPGFVEADPAWAEVYSTEPFFITCEGSTELPDATEINATAVTIDFVNDVTDDEEIIVGSYYLDDPTCLSRMATITWVHKIVDANLYKQIYMGGLGGVGWSSDPYISSVHLKVLSNSADKIGVPETADQYELSFDADQVLWAMDPVRLAGGDIVVVRLTGSVLYDPDDTFHFTLKNDKASYGWT